MALVQRKPTAAIPQPQTPKTTTFETVITDNRTRPVNSLLAYIDGSRWTVNSYYSQQLLRDDDPKALDVKQQDTYQTFKEIKNFELRVTSPFTVNQDQETNALSAEGTALIYPVLTPNVGDMFTATVGKGYEGIFRLTEVSQKHFNLDAVFEVQFSLFGIKDKNPEYFENIQSKVTRTYVFRKDRLVVGLNPIITTDEDNTLLDLTKQFKYLVDHYFTHFYKEQYSCFLLPDNTKRIYDPYVPLFLRSLLSSTDHLAMRDVKIYTLDGNQYANQKSIFDVILTRNKSLLSRVFRSFYLVSKQNFLRNGFLEGFRYQPVEYTVFPADLYGNLTLPEMSPLRFIDSGNEIEVNSTPIPPILRLMEQLSKETVRPLLPKPGKGSYLFNVEFYNEEKVSSILEQLLLDYLNNKSIELSALSKLVETATSWSFLEQFYYIPMLLLLMRVVEQQV